MKNRYDSEVLDHIKCESHVDLSLIDIKFTSYWSVSTTDSITRSIQIFQVLDEESPL